MQWKAVSYNRLSPTYPIAKILWLKRNRPTVYNRAYVFLQPKDYIVAKLTGVFLTDYSDASLTGMLDIRKRSWSTQILEEIDIDVDKLPPIHPSTQIVGDIHSDLAHSLGFSGLVVEFL